MYALSKSTGISESTLSRLKSNSQVKLSKKNLILLANHFCVNEDWLETGLGDREAPGIVRDATIHNSALWERFVQIAKANYGDEPLVDSPTISVDLETMSTYTGISCQRLWQIIHDNGFPTYTEILQLLKSDKRIDSNWLLLGVGNMFRDMTMPRNTERVNKLVDTITTLQDTISAKNDIIAVLNERIRQLENQTGSK